MKKKCENVSKALVDPFSVILENISLKQKSCYFSKL